MQLDTWFRPVSARPLAGLRVGLPLLLLLHLVWLRDDVLSLHGDRGLIPWELADLLRDPWLPGLPTLARALLPLGMGLHTAVILLLSAYAGSLLSLALGYFTRLSACLAWGLHLSLVMSAFASFYGVDQLANTFLFYLFLFPSGRAWTFASRTSSSHRGETIPVGCLRVMQFHLCVIYLAAGLNKTMGRQWWNGEAIWQIVSQPIFSTFDLHWLATPSWIPMLAGWATLVVEVGYTFCIWPRRTRKVWCAATIGLHLGIGLFMGLVFFSSVMILLTVCLFLIPEGLPAASRAWRLSDDFGLLVRRLMGRDQVPGVAVGVVERGRLVFARGFGHRDLDKQLPVTPDTIFPLGSCSKGFTAMAIAVLADEGRIDLDAPVRLYLPDFSLQDPLASATLTTRDLLTHRSGLPRHDLFWYQAPFSRDELYQRLRFLEPSGPARTQWRYNSLMFAVAGRIVEKVSGESWESFVARRILGPLHMHRTLLSAEAMAADADHASPYAIRAGSVQKIPRLEGLSAIAPAGAVQASVRDLAPWLAFHATRSPALLHEKLWRELHRPQADMPESDQPEVRHRSYALGWIHASYRGHPLVSHNGALDGFVVHLGFLPETGQGLMVLMNRDLATEALMAIAYSAYDRLLGLEPLDWEKRLEEAPTALPAVRETALDLPIEEVVGRYEHPAYGPLTIRAQGHRLVMQFRGLHATLVYQGERRFLSITPIADGVPPLSVRFSTPKTGEPLKLFVALNFDAGDPVEVLTRVSPPMPSSARKGSSAPDSRPARHP